MSSSLSLLSAFLEDDDASCVHYNAVDFRQSSLQASASKGLEAQLYAIPKTDFHCHLNGSISAPLLAHLERLVNPQDEDRPSDGMLFFDTAAKRQRNILAGSPTSFSSPLPPSPSKRSRTEHEGGNHNTRMETESQSARMHHCFTVFDNIYKLMTNLAFTRLAVQDMLLCSAAENVVVTEIRTSLREDMTYTFTRPPCDSADEEKKCDRSPSRVVVSKQAYVDCVLETVSHLLGSRQGVVDFNTGELIERSAAWETTFASLYSGLIDQGQSREEAEAGETNADDNKERHGSALKAMKSILDTTLHRLKNTMHVRLLLSVNRGASVAAAAETVGIAAATQRRQVRDFYDWVVSHRGSHEHHHLIEERLRTTCWVTGVDLSGNCYKGRFAELEPFFAALSGKDGGHDVETKDSLPLSFGLTFHGGEKQDADELAAMIACGPERWGHLVYTDDKNLKEILNRHDPIEICVTSNLLTGGHGRVSEHHLTVIMKAWEDLHGHDKNGCGESTPPPPSRALLCKISDNATYAESVRHRRHRRHQRYNLHRAKNQNSEDGIAPSPSGLMPIPNISFHTDDRGVFGTTAAHELFLASQHPLVYQPADGDHNSKDTANKGHADVVRGMLALERLSLLGVFDLHWAVLLLAVLLATECGGEHRFHHAEIHKAVAVLKSALTSFDVFVAQATQLSTTPYFPQLCGALSDGEWTWLTRYFDSAI